VANHPVLPAIAPIKINLSPALQNQNFILIVWYNRFPPSRVKYAAILSYQLPLMPIKAKPAADAAALLW
jgi:hypothetical protein